jgi:TolA-binding protein
MQSLRNNEAEKAIADFNEVMKFPRNLEIARDSRVALANYWLGKAFQKKGDPKKAKEYFTAMANNADARSGWGATGTALLPFYQALAFQELGNKTNADEIYRKLITQGNDLLNRKYHEASADRSVSIRE